MYPQWHLLSSLVVAAVSLLFNQVVPFFAVQLFGYNVAVFVLCLLVGVFIDVDHILDYRLNRSFGNVSLESNYRTGRMFVVFHGAENTVILAALSIVFPFLIFPTVSYTCHIIIDMYGNGVSYHAYFYVARFGRKLTRALADIHKSTP